MTEGEIEEETYSLIFKSLRHPIRRRILRMLTDGPKAFSEILGVIDIDSGHLSYHLDSLGELVTHAPEGKYKLSSIGLAATKLMIGVEEKTTITSQRSVKRAIFRAFAASFILLVSSSLFGSILLYGHTERMSGPGSSTWWFERTIPLNGTVSFNLTIVYKEGPGLRSDVGPAYYYTEVEMPVKTPAAWTRDTLYVTLHINGTGLFRIRIYDPNDRLIENETNWLDPQILGIDRTMDIEVENTRGPYRLSIDWLRTDQIKEASLSFEHRREWFLKPYYSYGIVGLLISTICLILISVLWVWTRFKP